MSEITFETLRLALESARGTAIASPTHLLNLEGTIKPVITRYRGKEQRGTRAANYRSVATRKYVEIEAEGDLDTAIAPVLLNMAVAPLTSPATPAGATDARLWAHVANTTTDTIKSATMWWGDPALDQLKSPFCVIDELVIENDASGEEVATVSIKGMGNFHTKVAAPGATSAITGALLPGKLMQCWIDSGTDAIGTTEINGRLVSAKHTIRTGAKYKYLADGPTSNLTFNRIGREKVAAVTTELVLELIDFDEFDLWESGATLKVRVRHNGALIESGTPDLYHYVEVDSYGAASDLDWGDLEGSNRTVSLTIEGEYDATLASDLRVAVQNARSSL